MSPLRRQTAQHAEVSRQGVRYPLAAPVRLTLTGFAHRAGVHPELVRRFVALGLIEADRDATGRLWFTPQELSTMARIQRLHAGLPVNYAAIGLILDLLSRINNLEETLRGSSETFHTTYSGPHTMRGRQQR